MTESKETMLIIMTTVALMIVAAILMGCQPAHGARGCLDRAEAARTWPTKQLAVDDDGCFTYMRRGLKPAPMLISATSNEAEKINMGPEPNLEHIALDMLQRWPVIVDLTPPPRIVEQEPLMTPRSVATVILAVILTCAVFEVAFGGMTRRPK